MANEFDDVFHRTFKGYDRAERQRQERSALAEESNVLTDERDRVIRDTSLGSLAGDSAKAFGGSLVNITGDIAATGVGLASPEAGHAMSKGLDAFNEFVNQSLSLETQRALRRNQRLNAILEEAAKKEYDQDIAEGKSPYLAAAKRYGKTFAGAASNMFKDPVTALHGTAAGAASLLFFGPAGKGTQIAAGGLRASRASRLGMKAEDVVENLFEKAVRTSGVPVSMGVSGGASAYVQVANELMEKDYQWFHDNSEQFRIMTEQEGLTPEQAKNRIIRSQSGKAFLKTSPGYGLAGYIARPFTERPLAFVSRGTALGTFAKEGAENVIQDTILPYQVGKAVAEIDPKRDPLKGIGTSAGESFVAGLGMAGAFRSPSLVLPKVDSALKKTKKGLDKFSDHRDAKVVSRGIKSFINEDTTVPESFASQIRRSDNYTEEEKEKYIAQYEHVKKLFSLEGNEGLLEILSEVNPEHAPEVTSKDDISTLAITIGKALTNKNVSKQDRVKLGVAFDHLFTQMVDALADPNYDELSTKVDIFKKNHEALESIVSSFAANENIVKSTQALAEMFEGTEAKDVSPETQDEMILRAKYAPFTLSHQNIIDLQKTAPEGSLHQYLTDLRNLSTKLPDMFGRVADQKLFTRDNSKLFGKSEKLPSLAQYWQQAQLAKKLGDNAKLAELEHRLTNFEKVQANKIEALEKSKADHDGKGTHRPYHYETWHPAFNQFISTEDVKGNKTGQQASPMYYGRGGKGEALLQQMKREQRAIEGVRSVLFNKATPTPTEAVNASEELIETPTATTTAETTPTSTTETETETKGEAVGEATAQPKGEAKNEIKKEAKKAKPAKTQAQKKSENKKKKQKLINKAKKDKQHVLLGKTSFIYNKDNDSAEGISAAGKKVKITDRPVMMNRIRHQYAIDTNAPKATHNNIEYRLLEVNGEPVITSSAKSSKDDFVASHIWALFNLDNKGKPLPVEKAEEIKAIEPEQVQPQPQPQEQQKLSKIRAKQFEEYVNKWNKETNLSKIEIELQARKEIGDDKAVAELGKRLEALEAEITKPVKEPGEVFNKLVGGVKSSFANAFTISKNTTLVSRLRRPIRNLYNMLKADNAIEYVKNNINRKFNASEQNINDFTKIILTEYTKHIKEGKLEELLLSKVNNFKKSDNVLFDPVRNIDTINTLGDWYVQHLKDPKNIPTPPDLIGTKYYTASHTSLVQLAPDGETLQINPTILEGSILGVLSAYNKMDANGSSIKMNEQAVRSLVGMDSNAPVSDHLERLVRRTKTRSLIAQDALDEVKKVLGVRNSDNVTKSYGDALLSSVVSNILSRNLGLNSRINALATGTKPTADDRYIPHRFAVHKKTGEIKIVKNAKDNIPFIDSSKQNENWAYLTTFTPNPLFKSTITSGMGVLDKINGSLVEKPVYFGDEEVPHSTKVYKGSEELTEREKQVLTALDNIPHYINPMYEVYNKFTVDDWIEIHGLKYDSKLLEKLPPAKRAEIEGKIITLFGEVNALEDIVKRAREEAELQGLDEPVIKYKNERISTGRFMQTGSYTPQASKFVRANITTKESVINLDSTNPDNHLYNWAKTIVQMVDEVKVEKLRGEEVLSALQDIRDNNYYRQIINSFDKPAELKKALIDARNNGIEITNELIHALYDVSNYEAALESSREGVDGPLENFRTHIGLESDGRTNGPAGAVMTMSWDFFDYATGGVNEAKIDHFINNAAKAGFFIGTKYENINTINDYLNSDLEGSDVDLYQSPANELSALISDIPNRLKSAETPQEEGFYKNLGHTVKLLSDALGVKGATFDIGENGEINVTINRSITKNPVTITVYGSGVRGLGSKLMQLVLDEYNDALANYVIYTETKDSRLPEVTEHLNRMTKGIERIIANNSKYSKKFEGKINKVSDIASFNLSRNDRFALNRAFIDLATGLQDAVDNSFGGGVIRGKNTLVTISSAIANTASKLFNNKLEELIKQKKKEHGAKYNSVLHGPTRKELNNIIKELNHVIMPYAHNDQKWSIQGDLYDKSTDTLIGQSTIKNNVTIQLYGVEETLSSDVGVKIVPYLVIGMGDANMVMKSFTGDNPVTNAMNAYDGIYLRVPDIEAYGERINQGMAEAWMEGNPFQAALEVVNNIRDTVVLEPAIKEGATSEEIAEAEVELATAIYNLKGMAENVNRLHDAINKTGFTSDQMGATESSYKKEGNGKTLVENLNEILTEDKETSKEAKETSNLLRYFDAVTDVKEVTIKELLTTISKNSENADYKRVAKILSDNQGALAGFKVVIGQGSQINKAKYPVKIDANEQGKIDFENKTIYIASGTSETALHELIHGATFATLVRELTNNLNDKGKPLNTDVAVLEQLALDFLESKYDDKAFNNSELKSAFDSLQAQIKSILNNRNYNELSVLDKASIINEVMAWSLANKHLRTKSKFAPLSKALRAVLNILSSILGTKLSVKSSVFEQIVFHTENLVIRQAKEGNLLNTSVSLSHRIFNSSTSSNKAFNEKNDPRLNSLGAAFARRLSNYIDSFATTQEAVDSDGKLLHAKRRAADLKIHEFALIGQKAQAAGLLKTNQQLLVYAQIAGTLSMGDVADTVTQIRMQEVFDKVLSELTVDKFLPDNPQPIDYAEAEAKLAFINDLNQSKDAEGKSRLASFAALLAVDSSLNEVVKNIELSPRKYDSNNPEEFIRNTYSRVLDSWYDVLSRGKPDREYHNAYEALESLTNYLGEQSFKQKSIVDKAVTTVFEGVNSLNNITKSGIKNFVTKAQTTLDKVGDVSNSESLDAAAKSMSIALNFFTEDGAKVNKEGLTVLAGQKWIPNWAKHLFLDLSGRTDSNKNTYDLIKKVNDKVQRTRQFYKDVMPRVIREGFKTEPTEQEWTDMYWGLGRTDIASMAVNSFAEVVEYINNPKARKDKIKELESQLKGSTIAKAEELAIFMIRGEVFPDQLRNADIIARRYNKGKNKEIDQLVSLYAYDKLSDSTKETLKRLVNTEPNGVLQILGILHNNNKEALAKAKGTMAEYNYLKGYISNISNTGENIRVMDDANRKELEARGYVRIGDYQRSSAFTSKYSRGYYYTPFNQRSRFNQGIVQVAKVTVGGVDTATGFTVDGRNAGFVTNEKAVAAIKSRLDPDEDILMPIIDSNGETVAYEQTINPYFYNRIETNTRLDQMIGYTLGRVAEEESAMELNKVALKAAHDAWMLEKDTDRFTNILSSKFLKDPVYKDAVKLLPPTLIEEAEALFGEGTFMVRNDLIEDLIGHRTASVRDFYNGVSRWPKPVQKAIQKALNDVLGPRALEYAVMAEDALNDLVKSAKQLIVIKSIIVPTINLTANIIQLMTYGIPINVIIKGLSEKRFEADYYFKSEIEKAELQTKLLASKGNKTKVKQLQTRIDAINKAQQRLSLWPLIEAGEFTSISRVDISKEDLLLTRGKLYEWMERKIDKLPPIIKNTGRYALMTQDTPMYELLEKATEYGDFLAKAILYDHHIKQGKSKDFALGKASDSFINYNRTSGRWRQTLENSGLLWFYNYKLRITKVAADMISEDPFRAVMMNALLPDMSYYDTPWRENIVAKMSENVLGYTVGPNMGLESYKWTPIGHLLN